MLGILKGKISQNHKLGVTFSQKFSGMNIRMEEFNKIIDIMMKFEEEKYKLQ